MTSAARVIGHVSPARHADLQQAEYYQNLLDEMRAEINQELFVHRAARERREQRGDVFGISRLHRIIRLKETELVTIDQLSDALSDRFPASQTYQPGF
jgi:hypothetical protein